MDLANNLDVIYIATAVVMGVMAIAFKWLYLVEAHKGITVMDSSVYNRYTNVLYWIANAMVVVLWFTSASSMDDKLLGVSVFFAGAWVLTVLAELVLSIVLRKGNSSVFREKLMGDILRILWVVLIIWLLY